MLLDEQSTRLSVRFGNSRGFLWTCQGDHPKMAQCHVSCSLLCCAGYLAYPFQNQEGNGHAGNLNAIY